MRFCCDKEHTFTILVALAVILALALTACSIKPDVFPDPPTEEQQESEACEVDEGALAKVRTNRRSEKG